MGRYALAQTMLQRAMEVFEEAGDVEGAGSAALSILEELEDYLSSSDRRSVFERAAKLLTYSEQPIVLKRLVDCARQAFLESTTTTKKKAQSVSLLCQ